MVDTISPWSVNAFPGTWPDDVTAAANGLMLVAQKTANETLGNSTTFQDDNELTIPVLANTSYSGVLVNILASPAGAGFKHQFTIPTSATLNHYTYFCTNPTTLAFGVGTAGWVNFSTSGATTQQPLIIWFSVTTGANAGYITSQWAKNAGDAGTTTVYAGSSLRICPATFL